MVSKVAVESLVRAPVPFRVPDVFLLPTAATAVSFIHHETYYAPPATHILVISSINKGDIMTNEVCVIDNLPFGACSCYVEDEAFKLHETISDWWY